MSFILNLNRSKEQSVPSKIYKRQYQIKHFNGRKSFKVRKARQRQSFSNQNKNQQKYKDKKHHYNQR